MKLEDLPKFCAEPTEVHENEVRLYGRFDTVPVMYGERSWLLNASVSYCGDILDVDRASSAAVFQCWDDDFVPELFDGGLAWMYGNYGPADVWKVLDESSVWIETTFQVSDAIATINGDYRELRPAVATESKTVGESTVSGGWDHEHCFVCGRQINGDHPRCFRSACGLGTFWWACLRCYKKWIVTHDIGFIVADHTDAHPDPQG